MWLGRRKKKQLPCAQTCHTPRPSMIEKGWINEQTSLAVVINVHLPVFLMGHLIKNLLVAAGLLSHPISAPPCQNLCHRPSSYTSPSPFNSNTSLVSHMTSVSRGPVMECCFACYASAGAPCWPTSILQPCCLLAAVAERPVTGWEVGRLESRFKGQWLRNQRELMQLPSITARCVHFKLDENPHLPGAYGTACTRLSSSSSSSVTDRGRSCLYLDAAQETVSSQMLLSVSVRRLKPGCTVCGGVTLARSQIKWRKFSPLPSSQEFHQPCIYELSVIMS